MSKKKLVSIVIPTKNSASFLNTCLKRIHSQSYKEIEVIIVDGGSTDNIESVVKKYKCSLLNFSPKVKKGLFDAPYKINYGANFSHGNYIYWLDADMELTKNILHESVSLCEKGADAVIIKEDSFGKGIWARAKQLERRCYWGDDTVESPRFYTRYAWEKIGGFDENLGGGGNDWDLYLMTKEKGFRVMRTKGYIRHNEGELKLSKLFKKRFMYGREALKYISKRPKAGFISFFPFRKAFFKNWKLFVSRPLDTIAFVIMRTVEYSAGFLGIIYAKISKQ